MGGSSDRDALRRAAALGAMLRCAPAEDPFEYRFMFDLAANTFLQKLVPKALMDRKLNLSPRGLFKSLLFLDFFTRVAAGDGGVLDNLLTIYRTVLKREKKYPITLELIVTEVALYSKEKGVSCHPGDAWPRFSGCPTCSCDAADLDPYYEGIGFMLLDQLEMKEAADGVRSRMDYRAAVFADAVVSLMPSQRGPALLAIGKGRFLDAALDAFRAFSESVGVGDLKACLMSAMGGDESFDDGGGE